MIIVVRDNGRVWLTAECGCVLVLRPREIGNDLQEFIDHVTDETSCDDRQNSKSSIDGDR